jgi:Zn-dependent peptidase ImmA (M78 family)
VRKLYFEEEAELFAYKAWNTLKLEPPVDLNLVAGRLGVDIHRREFSEEIDGFYLRLPREGIPPIIAVNSSYIKPFGRQRFTTAHEIAHHLLSHRLPVDSRLFFVDGLNTGRSIVERACDRFAALLLMPEDITRQWFEQLASNPDNRVAIMSERFGVSIQAMRVRLRELKLPYETYRYRSR